LLRFVRDHLLETYLRDNTRTRVLQPDGSYIRLSPDEGEPVIDSQTFDMGYHAHAPGSPEHYGR
jgi:polyphosphate kinase